MKTWGGRFIQPTDAVFERFNSSFGIDRRLVFEDIEGSLAYAAALERAGVLTGEELKQISKALVDVKRRTEKEPERLEQQKDEDVHTYVERCLFELIGDVAYKLHTGRSRNDQVALDMRLFLKRAIIDVQVEIKKLCRELVGLARAYLDVVIPGYTHLRKAQPLLFAHYLLAYFEMFRRDHERLDDCYRRTDTMPLGSGALAGSGFPLDRETLRKELGFAQLTRNSLDAVSDRDYQVEFAAAAALTLAHLSRMAEDFIIYSSSEFGLLELSDAVTTGSSIMPQKKNPDSLELVRGKTGRVFGNLVSLLTQLKGLPQTYNKDLQEDKECLFDTLDTVLDCLLVAQIVVRTLVINREAAQNAARSGFLNATDLADYLVRRGMPFRKAHELVGRIVLHCEAKHVELQNLSIEEFVSFSPLIREDVYGALTLENSLNARALVGGTAPARVLEALAEAEKFLDKAVR